MLSRDSNGSKYTNRPPKDLAGTRAPARPPCNNSSADCSAYRTERGTTVLAGKHRNGRSRHDGGTVIDSRSFGWRLALEPLPAVVEAYHESGGIYGYRKVHDDLQDRKIACCRETVRKVLRKRASFSRTRRKFVVTTDSNHTMLVAENLMDRNFEATAVNQKWAADITYIPTDEGWLYLWAW